MAEIVIGVLAIQGAVEEHAQSIRAAGGKAVEVNCNLQCHNNNFCFKIDKFHRSGMLQISMA